MKNAKIVFFIAVLSLLSGLVCAQISKGTSAPNFTCKTIDGKDFVFANAAKNKVVVLSFFATWCPPCKAEIPFIIQLNKWVKGKNAVVIGVSMDDGLDVIKDFVKTYKIKHIVLHDKRGAFAAKKYSVDSIPTLFIIDKKGIIREVDSGFTSDKAEQKKTLNEIMKTITKLL